MACEAVQMWSLSSLIAAFLDLTIAYVLLSASALAFVASKFLSFFELNLPCPCHGLFFGIRGKSLCLNTLLFDFPIQKLADILLYVRQAYPFSGCICTRTNSYSIAANDCSNMVLQIDCDDGSCSSSVSDSRRSIDIGGSKDIIDRAEEYAVKGKGIVCPRPKSRLRLRRKQVNGHGKHLSSSSYDHNRGEDSSAYVGERRLAHTSVPTNDSPDEDLCNKNMPSSSLKLCDDSRGDLSSSGDEKRVTRFLERALEEERDSRARIYIELEKERSASATAADEAMSMILRLQEEKASIEMEARQYQRIIEEKSAYDAEEMNILIEILVRREKEKLFLEKEVEGYRQMISPEGDYDEFCWEDAVDKFFSPRVAALTENQVERSIHGEHVGLPENSLQMAQDKPQEYQFVTKTDFSDTREDEGIEYLSPEEKIIVTCDGTKTGNPYEYSSSEQQAKDEHLQINFTGLGDHVLDTDFSNVHIICNVSKELEFSTDSSSQVLHDKDCVPIQTSTAKGLRKIPDCPSSSITDNGVNVNRSSLEIPKPRALSLLTELRRKSMSCADDEMLKRDAELGRLLKKLKLVQEHREKLISLSIENQEQGGMRTKSLDDIKGHEARDLSDSGKDINIPEVLSKKRCSSVSSGLWRISKGVTCTKKHETNS